ncbi:MAG: CoA transferase [Dehalococcoidia bacterium]|nr:MAG: CoA transferase [Dehalococcoidia bacterium]
MSERCLGHLKVLELCNLVAGPYSTKLLADLGAEVIKIERPAVGDDARRRGPFLNDIPDQEQCGLFLYLNTNKLGVTLDITTETGKDILLELIKQTDIFVEDNPPALMEELGLTYKDLRAVNPNLIMTSLTPFGQSGPYRDYRAYQLNTYHAGGEGYLMPIMSPDDSREPVRGGGLAGDCTCGLSTAIVILAAAYRKGETGVGQYVDVSRQDVQRTMVLLDVAMYANLGVIRNRFRRPLLMPLPMECRDGYLMMSALTDREWGSLVEFMGNPAWADDERFNQWLSRHMSGDDINPHVQEFVGQYNKEELFHRLQDSAIAAAPVNTAEDLLKSSQMEYRGFFTEIEHSKAGRLKYPTAGYKFSKTPWTAERAAPLLGQHNEDIYCERLGYSKEDLVSMREAGVI